MSVLLLIRLIKIAKKKGRKAGKVDQQPNVVYVYPQQYGYAGSPPQYPGDQYGQGWQAAPQPGQTPPGSAHQAYRSGQPQPTYYTYQR